MSMTYRSCAPFWMRSLRMSRGCMHRSCPPPPPLPSLLLHPPRLSCPLILLPPLLVTLLPLLRQRLLMLMQTIAFQVAFQAFLSVPVVLTLLLTLALPPLLVGTVLLTPLPTLSSRHCHYRDQGRLPWLRTRAPQAPQSHTAMPLPLCQSHTKSCGPLECSRKHQTAPYPKHILGLALKNSRMLQGVPYPIHDLKLPVAVSTLRRVPQRTQRGVQWVPRLHTLVPARRPCAMHK